ncbi:hypothetical protein BCR34DRAFT_633630 [Clohesyomyces aquaticus]|uniref:Uncharacterized protein n=1 Tax=Clohesyomyces aquaticus TaxID=1231657 RepID=A0A1Y2A4U0_9PLEO|nr:hypothetical protein BCR34DRAFT_633630 [Clohesyomyces aquaticus]
MSPCIPGPSSTPAPPTWTASACCSRVPVSAPPRPLLSQQEQTPAPTAPMPAERELHRKKLRGVAGQPVSGDVLHVDRSTRERPWPGALPFGSARIMAVARSRLHHRRRPRGPPTAGPGAQGVEDEPHTRNSPLAIEAAGRLPAAPATPAFLFSARTALQCDFVGARRPTTAGHSVAQQQRRRHDSPSLLLTGGQQFVAGRAKGPASYAIISQGLSITVASNLWAPACHGSRASSRDWQGRPILSQSSSKFDPATRYRKRTLCPRP